MEAGAHFVGNLRLARSVTLRQPEAGHLCQQPLLHFFFLGGQQSPDLPLVKQIGNPSQLTEHRPPLRLGGMSSKDRLHVQPLQ